MSLKDFENKDRLLSDDEKELIGVLASHQEHILAQDKRITALEDQVQALIAAFSASLVKKVDDAGSSAS